MTNPHPQTFPDQSATNSGGAVGFLVGGLAGIVLALIAAADPSLNAFTTPVESVIGGFVLGTFCGVIVGALWDASA